MIFKDALLFMKKGYKIRRKGWKGYWYLNQIYQRVRIVYYTDVDGDESDIKTEINLGDDSRELFSLEQTTFDDWEIVEE